MKEEQNGVETMLCVLHRVENGEAVPSYWWIQ